MKLRQFSPIRNAGIFLILVIFAACDKTTSHNLLITHANIIDVKTGEILKDKTVAIDSMRIAAIYDGEVSIPNSAEIIDGKGKYLIPGLWDMHAHYFSIYKDIDPVLIANGITGIREMWGDMSVINEVRKEIQTGDIIAPDIYTAGVVIDGDPPVWQGTIAVNTPEEARSEVDKQITEGVDFIKVYSKLSKECFMAIASEANKNHIPFAGHIPHSVSIYTAIEAGMASSEHFFGVLEGCSDKEDSILALPYDFMKYSRLLVDGFNEKKFDSLCTILANSNMWLCPTLITLRGDSYLSDTTYTNDGRLAYFPEYTTSGWFRGENPYYEKYYLDFRKLYHFEVGLVGKMQKKELNSLPVATSRIHLAFPVLPYMMNWLFWLKEACRNLMP